MARYSAQIYMHGSHGQWLTPIYPRISDIARYMRKAFDAKLLDHHDEAQIKEVVVLKGASGKKPTIHGYYDWDGYKLKLDKSKPAFIHNILYGLES
jgi:sugar phosphate isomerase/epimerase